jgi:hypothetical protein
VERDRRARFAYPPKEKTCSAITLHLIQAAPQKILLHTVQCLENFGSFSTLRW